MDWPKASISRAERSIPKTFSVIALIRLSSSPPAPLSHHLKAIENFISLWNSQVVSLMPKKYTATKVHLLWQWGAAAGYLLREEVLCMKAVTEGRSMDWPQMLQMPPEPYGVGRASAFRQFLKTTKLGERNLRHACFSAAQRGSRREEAGEELQIKYTHLWLHWGSHPSVSTCSVTFALMLLARKPLCSWPSGQWVGVVSAEAPVLWRY